MGKNRQIIDADLYVHFITFSVYRRRKLLDHTGGTGCRLRLPVWPCQKRLPFETNSPKISFMGKNRQIIDADLYVHFITFSVYRRRKLLDHDHAKRILLGWFNEVLEQFQAKSVGFVVMPDHIHALVWFPKAGQLSRFIHSWKRRSSLGLRDWYRTAAPDYFAEFGEGEHFW